jgi:hypothetical protein
MADELDDPPNEEAADALTYQRPLLRAAEE